MIIKFKATIDEDWKDVEIAPNSTIEDLYKDVKNKLPYQVIVAKVNNRVENLKYVIKESCNIELLDMRTQAANLIYQNSVVKLFLMAVKNRLGKVRVEIQNSLNKGLYVEIKGDISIDTEIVKNLEMTMNELASANLDFDEEFLDFVSDGNRLLVPSTSYVNIFQLRKYKRGILIRFPHPKDPSEIPVYEDEVKLYETFAEQTVWGKLLDVEYVKDLNAKIAQGKSMELIQLSEALHEKKIAQIADIIASEGKRIILIAGPSSSGKTTFAQRLAIQLKVIGLDPLYLGTDDYFHEREETPLDEKGHKNFEDLVAIDTELFNGNMNDLLQGKDVDLPKFDFITGKKTYGHRIVKIKKNQPIIIEGIHGLNDNLTLQIDENEKFKIYISPLTQLNIDEHNRIATTDARMYRRMVRDYKYRGKSAKATINEWPKVRAGEDKNIFPYNGKADVLFNSSHIYELAVLKKYAKPLLEQITRDEKEFGDAERMLRFLEPFEIIEEDNVIVNNSILREFIGGSVFVEKK